MRNAVARSTRPSRALPQDPDLRRAVWSVYVHGHDLQVDALPPGVRPMSLDAAVDTVVRKRGDLHPMRALGLLRQLARKARLPRDEQEHLFHADDAGSAASEKSVLIGVVPALAKTLKLDKGALLDLGRTFTDRGRPDEGCCTCTQPEAIEVVDPLSGTTSLTSSVLSSHTLEELLPYLDPRGWDEASDLFKSTYQVEDPDGETFKEIPSPWKDQGKTDWDGYLYELADSGNQQVENILYVAYRRHADSVEMGYSLYRSLAYRIGGLELPGVMRQNQGAVQGTRVVGGTRVEVTKTVKYERLSSWSGARTVDYGDALNYLARAYLAQWVDHLQFMVPCSLKLPRDPVAGG
jgi:hypothetical protein